MPFLTAGDPDLETTRALLDDLLGGGRGVHLAEIGVPYSDPIADGPVIAASYTRALGHGLKLDVDFRHDRRLAGDERDGPSGDDGFLCDRASAWAGAVSGRGARRRASMG